MNKVKVITITFAVLLVLIAASAQPVAAASRYDTLNSYISGRYDAEKGGYSPPSDGVVRVDATYGAILALDELGILDSRPPPVNLAKALDSLIDRQWASNRADNALDRERYGGFSEYLVGPVTMEMTYMGMILYQKLKAQSDYPGISTIDINTTALLIYVNRTQSANGGFSSKPNITTDIVSTYQALTILDLLDEYNSSLNAWDWLTNETATLAWINDCRQGDAFKLSPDSYTSSLTATAAGIMSLGYFQNVLSIPGLQAANSWILERQILEAESPDFTGGFEEGNGTADVNLASTYYALKALDFSGADLSVNESAVTDFILDCQAADGSWGYVPGEEVGSLMYAGQACELLNIISHGDAGDILASSEDPNVPSGFILDWRFFVVGGIIVVALVLAVVSLRWD